MVLPSIEDLPCEDAPAGGGLIDDPVRARFFSLAAHDLKAPLSSISLGVEILLLRGDRLEASERERISRAILEQAGRAQSAIDRFVQLSRQFAGMQPFSPRRISVDSLVEQWERRNWGTGMADSGARVRTDVDCGREGRLLDPDLVEPAVLGVVENALRFSPAESPVQVQIRGVDDRLVFRVADGGPGIPESERDRIFDAFYRGSAGKASGGSGLGLTLARECTVAHGGTLRLVKTDEGGSVFELAFDAPAPPPQSEPASVGGNVA